MIAHASAVRSGAKALLQNKPGSVRVKEGLGLGYTCTYSSSYSTAQDWRTGEVDLGPGTDDERAARSEKFGGESTQLKLEVLREVLGGLSK